VATLQVKHLPDELHALLAQRARAQGTTMADYVTALLRRDLTRPTVDEWLAAHPATGEVRDIDVASALDEVRVEDANDEPTDADPVAGSASAATRAPRPVRTRRAAVQP
jgi:plasmid stability protein